MPNPLVMAIKGKGVSNLVKRSLAIGRRYGVTISKMERALGRFAQVLSDFDCGATFPLTAWTLSRTRGQMEAYQDQNIEFAIHGYYHVDYSQLSLEQQMHRLREARQMFDAHGLNCKGFRSPYLRYNQDTLSALSKFGFSYDSSQGIAWDVVEPFETEPYRHVLDFYRAKLAEDYVSVPRLVMENGLVQIPYSLPDDEALVERLKLTGTETMGKMWVEILHRTHKLGELFTLGLHPERIALCEDALRAVLRQARVMSPAGWIARLDEIADWWRQRAATTYKMEREREGTFRLAISGPPGVVVLARDVLIEAPTESWAEPYQRVLRDNFTFRAERLPLIGISPESSDALVSFLEQQGYLIERDVDAHLYTYYLDRKNFALEDERPMLQELEGGDWPLLRLARWPNGAQSALAITGDIDALTLWDYALRFFVN